MIKIDAFMGNETVWAVSLRTSGDGSHLLNSTYLLLLSENGTEIELTLNGTPHTILLVEECVYWPFNLSAENEIFYKDTDANKRVSAGDSIFIYRYADNGKPIDGYTLLLLDENRVTIGSVIME